MECRSSRILEFETPIGDSISRIRFSPTSNHLLISSWDSILRLYDTEGDVLRLEAPSEGALLDCCFGDEVSAFTASSDGGVRRYDLCSGIQNTVVEHEEAATLVEYSREVGQLISAGLEKKLNFLDMRTNKGYSHILGSKVESLSLCGFYLIVAIGRHAKLYDLRNMKETVQQNESSMEYQIKCVRSFSNCQGYAIGSIDGRVSLNFFDPSITCKSGLVSGCRCIFRCHPKSKDGRHYLVGVNDIDFHPCRGTFITGDNKGYAIIWDAQSRKRLFEFPRYPNSVASLSYNPNGQQLAVASSYTYQEESEAEDAPQIFLHELENIARTSSSD